MHQSHAFRRVAVSITLAVVAVLTMLASVATADNERLVRVEDRCDPPTFNAVLGEEICVGDGNVTFEEFIEELQDKQEHGAWRFHPDEFDVEAGETLVVRNDGGEAHTFTLVEEFGGGLVPELNELSGNPDPAPECNFENEELLLLEAGDTTWLPTGNGTARESGTFKFMCCIHPWMRSVVMVR